MHGTHLSVGHGHSLNVRPVGYMIDGSSEVPVHVLIGINNIPKSDREAP